MADSAPLPPGSWPVDPALLWQAWWRSLGVRLPLSGDVTQSIDTAVFRATAEQLGFININTAAAGDPELERRITAQVASYGRQLGRVLDAFDVVLRHVDLGALPPADAAALDALAAMRADIEAVKERTSAADLDHLLVQVRRLKRDPERNREALTRLRAALDDG